MLSLKNIYYRSSAKTTRHFCVN